MFSERGKVQLFSFYGSEERERERDWLWIVQQPIETLSPKTTRENTCSQSTTFCMLICVPCRSPSIQSFWTFHVLCWSRAAPYRQLIITIKEVVNWSWVQSLDFTDEHTHPIAIGGHWTEFNEQPSVSAAVTSEGTTTAIYEQQLSTAHSDCGMRRLEVNSGELIFHLTVIIHNNTNSTSATYRECKTILLSHCVSLNS